MAKTELIRGKRAAVKRALAHEEVWPVPYYVNADAQLVQNLQERFGFSDFEQFIDSYMLWEQAVPLIPSDLQGDRYTDIWGITWAGVGVTRGYVVHHPIQAPSLREYTFPESCPDEIIDRLRRIRQQNPETFLLVKLGDLFERAHYLRGMEQLMVDMYRSPGLCRRTL